MQLVLDTELLTGPMLVTSAYILLWYYILGFIQRRTKYALKARYEEEGKEFDRYFGQDEEMLAADRAVINTQEQMVPFLASLWLCAVFASPSLATWLGSAYIVLRAFYPALLGKRVSKIQSPRVMFVTLPCYLIIFTLLGNAVWSVVVN